MDSYFCVSSCFCSKIITSVFEIVFYLIAGGGSTGAAPEQTPDLLNVWIAKGATAALLPPGLLGRGGGGGGGDRPIPRGQLANATGQLRGTVQISKPHKHTHFCLLVFYADIMERNQFSTRINADICNFQWYDAEPQMVWHYNFLIHDITCMHAGFWCVHNSYFLISIVLILTHLMPPFLKYWL